MCARALPASSSRRAEVRVQQRQHLVLGRADAGIVDQWRRAQALEALAGTRAERTRRCASTQRAQIGDRLDVDVDRVQVLPRRRAVRADVRRVVAEQRVQRIEADDAGAARAHCSTTRPRSPKSPMPQLRVGAQRIELQRRPEDAAVALRAPAGRQQRAGAVISERLAVDAVDAQRW